MNCPYGLPELFAKTYGRIRFSLRGLVKGSQVYIKAPFKSGEKEVWVSSVKEIGQLRPGHFEDFKAWGVDDENDEMLQAS